jgi:hypothetical protein
MLILFCLDVFLILKFAFFFHYKKRLSNRLFSDIFFLIKAHSTVIIFFHFQVLRAISELRLKNEFWYCQFPKLAGEFPIFFPLSGLLKLFSYLAFARKTSVGQELTTAVINEKQIYQFFLGPFLVICVKNNFLFIKMWDMMYFSAFFYLFRVLFQIINSF